jgi:hypothetical protein
MASYPYYQPSNQKTNHSTTPGMVKGTGNPPAVRPAAQPKPVAESSEDPGEAFSPITESPVYSSEIGREAIQIHLNRDDVLKGLIYSEILAPPKSRRTGR